MVQTVPGNTWIDGGEENVAVAKTIHYTADEVKAGDYIYSGRSTSDGGLRKRYPNGKAQVIADPKPQSVAGKTVAGVVFCIPKDTDPTGRLTPARLTDDKIMMKDFPNAEIWNYIVNPSLVAAGGPTPIIPPLTGRLRRHIIALTMHMPYTFQIPLWKVMISTYKVRFLAVCAF